MGAVALYSPGRPRNKDGGGASAAAAATAIELSASSSPNPTNTAKARIAGASESGRVKTCSDCNVQSLRGDGNVYRFTGRARSGDRLVSNFLERQGPQALFAAKLNTSSKYDEGGSHG